MECMQGSLDANLLAADSMAHRAICPAVGLSVLLVCSMHLYLFASVDVSIYLSFFLSFFLSFYLSTCLAVSPFFYVSIYPSIFPSVCLSVYVSISLSLSFLSVPLSIYLSVFLLIYFVYPSVSCLSGASDQSVSGRSRKLQQRSHSANLCKSMRLTANMQVEDVWVPFAEVQKPLLLPQEVTVERPQVFRG